MPSHITTKNTRKYRRSVQTSSPEECQVFLEAYQSELLTPHLSLPGRREREMRVYVLKQLLEKSSNT